MEDSPNSEPLTEGQRTCPLPHLFGRAKDARATGNSVPPLEGSGLVAEFRVENQAVRRRRPGGNKTISASRLYVDAPMRGSSLRRG